LQKAAFLDRDGVINAALLENGKPRPPRRRSELQFLPGAIASIEKLMKNDYEVVVVTNQPDLARGALSHADLSAINDEISINTGISNFYICEHDEFHNCSCRKPKPGLIVQAAKDLELDLSKSFMVGDRWKDVSAAQSINLKCYFIDYSYEEPRPNIPFVPVSSLFEAVSMEIGDSSGFNN
jgi:D-glycero-D-manno-heptose 1,7-bisphosphate phosphatase